MPPQTTGVSMRRWVSAVQSGRQTAPPEPQSDGNAKSSPPLEATYTIPPDTLGGSMIGLPRSATQSGRQVAPPHEAENAYSFPAVVPTYTCPSATVGRSGDTSLKERNSMLAGTPSIEPLHATLRCETFVRSIRLAGSWRSALPRTRIAAPIATTARTSATTAFAIRRLRSLRSRRRRSRSNPPGSRSTLCDSRSRIADSSLIDGRLHQLLERRSPLEGQGADRRRLHTERPGSVLRAEAEHLGQDEGGALPRRELGKGLANDLSVIGLRELVHARAGTDRPLDGHHCALVPAPEDVHRRAVQVRGRIIDLTDAVPALPESEERVLHDLLSLGPVARHDPEASEERAGL